jgi:hypothetical protein
MPSTPSAGPELHRRPRLSRRWVLHLHLVTAPLTANLHTCTSHGLDCTARACRCTSRGLGVTSEDTACIRRRSNAVCVNASLVERSGEVRYGLLG